jgi:hypothetical protein
MELLRWVGFPPRKRATRGFGVRVCSFRVYRRQTFPYQEAVKESNSALSSVMVQAH